MTVPKAPPLPTTLEAASAKVWLPFSTKLMSNADKIWASGNCTIVVGANCSSATVGAAAMATKALARQAVANLQDAERRTFFHMMILPQNEPIPHSGSMSRSTHGSTGRINHLRRFYQMRHICFLVCPKQQLLLVS